jgi:hypothetical protein
MVFAKSYLLFLPFTDTLVTQFVKRHLDCLVHKQWSFEYNMGQLHLLCCAEMILETTRLNLTL